MIKRDFYELLGVARNASPANLKKAYWKQAKRSHPDLHGGDTQAEKRFKEINEAYEVLKDDQKRAAYDRFGHAAFENGGRASSRTYASEEATRHASAKIEPEPLEDLIWDTWKILARETGLRFGGLAGAQIFENMVDMYRGWFGARRRSYQSMHHD